MARTGDNYSGARWPFAARRPYAPSQGTRPGDELPKCPACGCRYITRRGSQRCLTLPGVPRCERDGRARGPLLEASDLAHLKSITPDGETNGPHAHQGALICPLPTWIDT